MKMWGLSKMFGFVVAVVSVHSKDFYPEGIQGNKVKMKREWKHKVTEKCYISSFSDRKENVSDLPPKHTVIL